MSLWKFGNFETEVDFTDADFLDAIYDAKKSLNEDEKQVPKVGKSSDIIRAQCKCFFNFFDNIFGDGASDKMFEGRNSVNLCIEAIDSLLALENDESKRFDDKFEKYNVQSHGNRQQRRQYNKQNGHKNYGKKK